MKIAYNSNVGQIRQVNQDRVCVLKNDADEYFGIVCDGMGGHLAGELAAGMATDILCESFIEASPLRTEQDAISWLHRACQKANTEIYSDAKSNRYHQGMGTTIVCCIVLKDVMVIGHVGDSRAYLIENNQLIQLTKDHTYVNLLVDSGSITKEEARTHPKRNILMKALGVFEEVVVSTLVIENKKQMVMLCSDGLYNAVSEEEVMNILQMDTVLEDKVIEMVHLANQNGGPDNISVVLMNGGEC